MRPLTATTERQREIHRYMLAYQSTHGMPPTVREIGEAMGIRSPNGVMCHLKSLERRGMVKRAGIISRGNLAVGVDEEIAGPLGDCCPTCGRPSKGQDDRDQPRKGCENDGQGTVE